MLFITFVLLFISVRGEFLLQVKIWFQNRRMKWKRSKKAAVEARQQKDETNNADKAKKDSANVTSASDAEKTDTSLDTSGEKDHEGDDDMSAENIDVTEIDDEFDQDDAEMSDSESAVSMTVGEGVSSLVTSQEPEMMQNIPFHGASEVRNVVEPSHG